MKDEKKTKIYNVLIAILTFTIIALTIVFEFNVPAEVTFAIIIIGSVLLVALVIILVLEIRLEKKMKREKNNRNNNKKEEEK